MPRFITSSVVLLLVAAAGVIGGAQAEPTAVARPAARDSTASRGWGHKNEGGHDNKHDDKDCVGAQVDIDGFVSAPCGGKHGKCCEGWMCKTEGEVFVKLGDSKISFITSTAAPYDDSFAKVDQCCLSEKQLDVTTLFCPPDAIVDGKCIASKLPFDFSSGKQAFLDNLACACCDGKITIRGSAKFRLICNAGGAVTGTCMA